MKSVELRPAGEQVASSDEQQQQQQQQQQQPAEPHRRPPRIQKQSSFTSSVAQTVQSLRSVSLWRQNSNRTPKVDVAPVEVAPPPDVDPDAAEVELFVSGEFLDFMPPPVDMGPDSLGKGGLRIHQVPILRSPFPIKGWSERNERDMVEFTSVEYLCYEEEMYTMLTIKRHGARKGTVKVSYKSEDINVGHYYVQNGGEITFESGEGSKEIKIHYQNDPAWNVEKLFRVVLKVEQGEAFEGSRSKCTVVVLNDDDFPFGLDRRKWTDRVQLDKCASDGIPKSDNLWLIFIVCEFFVKEVYTALNHDKQGKGPNWGLFWKLFPGLYFVGNQIITQYLLTVLTDDEMNLWTKNHWLISLGAAYMVNVLVAAYADISFAALKLQGRANRYLRTAACSIVMQLTPKEQEYFDTGMIVKIVDRQVDEALSTTWICTFVLFGELAKLIAMIGFVVALSIQLAAKKGAALLALMVVPFSMMLIDGCVLAWNMNKASDLYRQALDADDTWSNYLIQCSFLRPMITNYRQGFWCAKTFARIHRNFNRLDYESQSFSKKIQWVTILVPAFTAACVLYFCGLAVVNDTITISIFVVFLSTTNNFGFTIGNIVDAVFKISQGYASILKIASLFNGHSDRNTRRMELFMGKERRQRLVEDFLSGPLAGLWDDDSIIISDAEYAFDAPLNVKPVEASPDQAHAAYKKLAVGPVNIVIEQRQMIVVRDRGAKGKRTLLRLLARHYVPGGNEDDRGGFIWYPDNWVATFLDAQPYFFGPTKLVKMVHTEHGSNPRGIAMWPLKPKDKVILKNGEVRRVGVLVEITLLDGERHGRRCPCLVRWNGDHPDAPLQRHYLEELELLEQAGTIAYNLRFGNDVVHTDREIWELCKYFEVSRAVIGSTLDEFMYPSINMQQDGSLVHRPARKRM